MKHLLFDLNNLFVKPYEIKNIDPRKNIKLFILYFLYFFFISILFSFLIGLIFIKEKPLINNNPVNLMFFHLVIIGPIVEELIFRLILRINKRNIFILISTILLFVLKHNLYISNTIYNIFILILLVTYLITKQKLEEENKVKNKYLYLLVYISSILFGIYHIQNLSYSINYISLIYVFSKS